MACKLGKTSFDELLYKIDGEFKDGVCNIEGLRHWMENYQSQKCDWEKYAYSNPAEGYSRNLVVEKPGMYTALILCWQPNKGSKIHAHSGSDCFLKILHGSLKEEQFEWPTDAGSQMKLKEEHVYQVDQLNHMTDEKGLHRVTNNDDNEVAVSLHIYMPPFKRCKWFHEETGKQEEAIMTFASIEGKPTGDCNALAWQCAKSCQKENSKEFTLQCPKECIEKCPKESTKQCAKQGPLGSPMLCTKECTKQCPVDCSKQCSNECSKQYPMKCTKQCPKECTKQCTKQCQCVCQDFESCH